ncbi:unnamed protein product, partial [Mesorhabditis belari]|uniref:Mothers against decapentaplegic homolog n=1 Tax=Mesorhabditis belari TaxID=2138241 RepID=A0AAF3J7W8_9BILA
MRSLFDSAPPNTVQRLCNLVKQETIINEANDDPKWAEKTVKSLYKKLKKAKALEELERAISHEDRLSDCIVIQSTLDGKATSTKKAYPHVLYSRMWRFPWVRSHNELKTIPNCRYPYAKKMAQVCINPYHYEAYAPPPTLPPIFVPRSRNYGGFNPMPAQYYEEIVPNTSFSGDEMRGGFLSEASSPSGSDLTSPSQGGSPFFTSVQMTSHSQDALSPQSYLSDDAHQEMMEVDDESGEQRSSQANTPDSIGSNELVEYWESDCWMTLTYHEMDKRVGEPFNAAHPYLLVDGFSAPHDTERFCLGYLNNVNRLPTVADARRHIGRGLRFYYIGGEVYIECLSEAAVFVQSPNCNQRHGWHPSTVCKVPPHCNLKIFNNAEFAQMLSASVKKGFEAVYALTRMCTIRISFVKGWGAEYRRQTVMHTPCWIEAHLNGPLQWIDRVLISMGAPSTIHSSYT